MEDEEGSFFLSSDGAEDLLRDEECFLGGKEGVFALSPVWLPSSRDDFGGCLLSLNFEDFPLPLPL